MAHLEPALRRAEPRHPDAATVPGLRRLDVVGRRSEGPDLDARTGHARIIRARPPEPHHPPLSAGEVLVPDFSRARAVWRTLLR